MDIFNVGFLGSTAGGGAGAVGGWVELARTTLGSAGDTIAVSSLADKRYYMILCDLQQVTSNIRSATRLNGDTGSNYATRDSENGGADSTASGTYIKNSGSLTSPMFNVQYLANLSSKEKLLQSWNIGRSNAGAGTAPERMEAVGKHAQTSNPISTIAQYNDQGGSYDTNSEVVVLGWDPADTHTTNFWEQLADVSLSSSADFFSSGTITAKKYLWLQTYIKQASPYSTGLQFNSDTANNYAFRYSGNGNSDATITSTWKCASNYSSLAGGGYFMNAFIINNASNEKLVIAQTSENSSSGAGTVPNRLESAGKWANTSDQITSIQMRKEAGAGGGQLQSGSLIKVWGSN